MTEVAVLEKAISLASERHQELEKLLISTEAWQRKSETAHQEVSKLETEAQHANDRLNALQSTLTLERAALAKLVEAARALKQERDGANTQVNILTTRMAHESELHAEQRDVLSQRVAELESSSKALQELMDTQARAAAQSKAELENRLAEESRKHTELRGEHEEAQRSKQAVDHQLAEITAQLEISKQRETALVEELELDKHQIAKLDRVLQDERASHDAQITQQAALMQAEIGRGQERNRELSCIIPDLESQLQALRESLAGEQAKTQQKTQEALELADELEDSKRTAAAAVEREAAQTRHWEQRAAWLQSRLIEVVSYRVGREALGYGLSCWKQFVGEQVTMALQAHVDDVTLLTDPSNQQEFESLGVSQLDIKRIAAEEFGLHH
eukprot:TRINITY_DN5291_c0_g1_i2.p1 TRINITY_DN5291_c0_g1~~TRINITY_DN5291_c0_g1_i2.p1  ORF type:complete len:388 (+),score=124.10 TRINITY_DN5291_c0_g1_i2:52-1215(+)